MDAIPAQAPPVPVCMVEAARDYSIPLRGLISVWLTEGGKLGTLSPNKNGTIDHGPFQINTVWTDYLAKNFGVTKEVLTNDFCWSARRRLHSAIRDKSSGRRLLGGRWSLPFQNT